MTRCQLHFSLDRPADDPMADAINKLHSVYGIQLVRLAPALDRILVEYDASRLTESQVEATLRHFALPIQRILA